MTYRVSVLSSKGTKKDVLTTIADRYVEDTQSRHTFLSSGQTRLRFYINEDKEWYERATERLVASVLIDSAYVVEEVSNAAYS